MSSLDTSALDIKNQMKPYALIGIGIAFAGLILASMLVSYKTTGHISLMGIIDAQVSNPALWVFDLLFIIFVFWIHGLREKFSKTAETIIDNQTEELRTLNSNLARQLNYESNYDAITKLPNHSQLIQKTNQAIEHAAENESVAIIVLTIKGFKELNYNFGSYHANTMLKQFGEKLKKVLVRPFMLDTKMGMGFLAHIQGNAFALLIPSINPDIEIDSILQQIVAACKTECTIDDTTITLTAIASAALYPQNGDGADILLHRANVALFHTKKDGKGYSIYIPSMEDALIVNRSMLDELKKAIDNDDLEIYYQPNVELSSGKIIGAEALIRFHNPEFGMLNADKLIPLVEGMNLMKQLTCFVLRGVAKQLAQWREQGYNLTVSINLSAADVVDIELPQQIEELITEYQLPPEVLKFEITERACLKDRDKTLGVLNALTKMGIKISIEDFCGGYSSFDYVMSFPISEVKIDKSFVMSMLTDLHKRKMVVAITALAKVMDMDVYAIGVENKAIVDELLAIGCPYGQGFYYSKAIKAEDFTQLLSESPNSVLLKATRSPTDSLPL